MKNVLRVMAGLMMALVMVFASGCGTKVSDFRAQKFQELKGKVEHEPAWVYLMQKVLDSRHGSVRAKSIEVEDLTVNLLGDDAVVKRDLSNLKSIDAKFRVTWDGNIHKDGFTCTTLVFDKDWNIKKLIPGETDAKIDHHQGIVKQALRSAKSKVGEVVDATKAKLSEMKPQVDEVVDKAKAKLEEVKPQVTEVVDKAKAKLEEMKPQLNEAMQLLEQQLDGALQRLLEEL